MAIQAHPYVHTDAREFEPMAEFDQVEEFDKEQIGIAKLNRDAAIHLFKKLGLACIKVNFNGEGDSGSIEDILVDGLTTAVDKIEVPEDVILQRQCDEYAMVEGKLKPVKAGETIPTTTLDKFIEEFADLILQELPYDWCNNDGGRGTINIFPLEDRINIHYQQRETRVEYEDHYLEG